MGTLTGAAVRQAGGSFALRYVGILANPKCIEQPELRDLVSAGVQVGFVFESWEARATEGFDAGVMDARGVAAYMKWLGLSDPPSVFYAVDADVAFEQVKPYFEGVNSVRKGGVYGSDTVVAGCLDNNLVTDAWQTVAWSRGVIEPRARVYQTGEQVVLSNGTKADVNKASGYGSWAYPMGDDVSWTEELTFNDVAYQAEPETETAANWLMYDNKKTEQVKGMVQQLLDRPAAGTVQLSTDQFNELKAEVKADLQSFLLDLLHGAEAAVVEPPVQP
jgi:hypothetical protein